MKLIKSIDSLLLLQPDVHHDERGFFYEKYKESSLNKIMGRKILFRQDNISYSKKNVLRGLHFQLAPNSQEKFISVVSGEIFDVVVNINPKSNNFKKHYVFKC